MLNGNHSVIALTAADWDSLQTLATRVGLSAERIGLLRRRVSQADSHSDGSCTVLAGRPSGGIDLLLARWISPDAADALAAASGRPLVIGRLPQKVQPPLGEWPVWKWPDLRDGHLIALRADGVPSSAVMGQLASIECVEQLVLVTRLGQPLHPKERELARAMSAYIPTVRVVAVAVPGEEPTDDDLAALAAFALSQMRDAGFRDGRCLAAGVWFTEASARRPGTIQDLAHFLTIDRAAVMEGRIPMVRRQLCAFLEDIQDAAGRAPHLGPPVMHADARMLSESLQVYLANLGRELARVARGPRVHNDESLRSYFLDRIRGWGAYVEPEGMWLKHVEALRPGTQAALMAEAAAQSLALNFASFTDSVAPSSKSAQMLGPRVNSLYGPDAIVDLVLLEAKRLVVALAIGIGAFFLTDQIPLPLARIPSYAALVLGTILGYGAARRLLRGAKLLRGSSYEDGPPLLPPAAGNCGNVDDWTTVERHLLAWFNTLICARPAGPMEECRRFVEQLGCGESQT